MSKLTKRKHVIKELLNDDFSLPKDNQKIVRVIDSRGNNLHEIEEPNNTTFLVSMPTKFRRNIWIKKGNYIIIETIEEGEKVKGEIVRILNDEHIKHFKKLQQWPFRDDNKGNDLNDDDTLFVNTNRQNQLID